MTAVVNMNAVQIKASRIAPYNWFSLDYRRVDARFCKFKSSSQPGRASPKNYNNLSKSSPS